MSAKIYLDGGTKPAQLEADVDRDRFVTIGKYSLSMTDFLRLALHAMTGTNLEGPEDPRLKFLEQVRAMDVAEGSPTGSGHSRLRVTTPSDK